MSSKSNNRGRRCWAVMLLAGGMLLAGYGPGVALANHETACNREGTSCWPVLHGSGNSNNNNNGNSSANPLTDILTKVKEVLTLLKSHPATDLSGVTQTWDKVLPGETRFVILAEFNNAAVRDNETGLVWERSPSMETFSWFDARAYCITKNVGGRQGWRVPSIEEAMSLIDPSSPGGPRLPAGHPFLNILSAYYWSATTKADSSAPTNAWDVNFTTGGVGGGTKVVVDNVWCLRGGGALEAY